MPVVLPTELIDAYKNGRLSLFIGSGVSSASGIISWGDLIDQMCDVIRNENQSHNKKDIDSFLAKGDYLDIAEVYKDTVGERQYFRFLREHIRKDVKLSKLHKAIAKLENIKIYYTTNYDKLLETCLREKDSQDPLVVIHPDQLGFENPNEKRIIKLHGDIDHPRTVILTRKDYGEYKNKHVDFENGLRDSLANSTLLFIGFGLRDQNFRRIYDDARSFYDSVNHKAFALMVGTDSLHRDIWDRKDNLRVIEMKKYSSLATVVNQLFKS